MAPTKRKKNTVREASIFDSYSRDVSKGSPNQIGPTARPAYVDPTGRPRHTRLKDRYKYALSKERRCSSETRENYFFVGSAKRPKPVGTNQRPSSVGTNGRSKERRSYSETRENPFCVGSNKLPKSVGTNGRSKESRSPNETRENPTCFGYVKRPRSDGTNQRRNSIGTNHRPYSVETTNQKPNSVGTNIKPKSFGTNRRPYSAGTNQRPKSVGTNQKPYSVGTNQMPYSVGTDQSPKSTETYERTKNDETNEKPNLLESIERPNQIKPKESHTGTKNKSNCISFTCAEAYEARKRQLNERNWFANTSLRLALGMTCPNRNCLAVDPGSGAVVYPASGVAVLLDTLSLKQLGYVQASKQSISCVNFSPDGQYILLGELGHRPALWVWSRLLDYQVAKFQGHEFGVAFASFSRSMDVLVSLGTNHDGSIYVWSWPNSEMISCNRFAEVIYAMSFSLVGSYFVTCGFHHIRFWYPCAGSWAGAPETLPGRSVIMRDNKKRTFVDVAFGSMRSEKFVYSVTTCGLVCKINSQRQVTHFLKLQKSKLTSVQVKDDLLVVGTAQDCVHFLSATAMQYKFSVTVPLDESLASPGHRVKFRGNIYLGLDDVHKQLTAVLGNGDLCVWDVANPGSITRKFFASGHNKVISGLDGGLTAVDTDKASDAELSASLTDRDTAGDTIVSVSHDGTLRQWKLTLGRQVSCKTSRALYTGNYNTRDPATCDTEVITVVKICQELSLVVIGDSKGVLTVYEAESLEAIRCFAGHSRGVTVIFFHTATGDNRHARLMLSGGRDRFINVYDLRKDFQLLNSICIHSGSILAAAMVESATSLMLISSGLDRIVSMSCSTKTEPYYFTPRQCRHTTASVVDIRVCARAQWVVLGMSNAMLTVIDTHTFQSVRTFCASQDPRASLERLCLDARGVLLVTACSDRSINLLSVPLGVHLACLTGHAAHVSGLGFTSDMQHIISSSRDGCIFLWKVPSKARRRANRLFKTALRRAAGKARKSPSSVK